MSDYFVVAGLGNPGREYEGTRHNAGFAVIDALLARYGADNAKMKTFGRGLIKDVRAGDRRILLLKPLTYMNRSGESVREVVSYFKVEPDKRLLVVCDDIYLAPGTLRFKRNGSDGGHNGLKSIIQCLDGRDFMRLRVGVGDKASPDADLASHVLSGYDAETAGVMKESFERAADAVLCLIEDGIDTAMNRFNGSAAR